jgi:hypothetical protein
MRKTGTTREAQRSMAASRARCGRKPDADEGRGQVAAVDAADGRGVVNDQDGQSEPNKAEMEFIAEVARQPIEVEPPDGIGEELGMA